jgi:hypothetical protein
VVGTIPDRPGLVSLTERLRRLGAGFRRLSRLPSSDRGLFLQAWQALLVSRVQVRLGRIDWTEAVVEKPAARATQAPIEHLLAVFEQARETCPVGACCLPRSLALRLFLERQGVGTRLRLGARKISREWSGHVWVEREGRLVGDRPELVRQFVPFHETA